MWHEYENATIEVGSVDQAQRRWRLAEYESGQALRAWFAAAPNSRGTAAYVAYLVALAKEAAAAVELERAIRRPVNELAS